MIVLGLTGSIGMGKSTAADMLRQMGVPVHDSDDVARALTGPGGAAVAQVATLFPESLDKAKNAIKRDVLGSIVFADADKKAALEAIIHPLVRASQQDFLRDARARGATIAVLDIPLLYETGAEARVDKVIVMSCPAFLQKRRVMARQDMTEGKFTAIIAQQMPDYIKRHRADFVVQTGLGRAYTFRALKRIIQSLNRGCRHDQKRNHFPS